MREHFSSQLTYPGHTEKKFTSLYDFVSSSVQTTQYQANLSTSIDNWSCAAWFAKDIFSPLDNKLCLGAIQ